MARTKICICKNPKSHAGHKRIQTMSISSLKFYLKWMLKRRIAHLTWELVVSNDMVQFLHIFEGSKNIWARSFLSNSALLRKLATSRITSSKSSLFSKFRKLINFHAPVLMLDKSSDVPCFDLASWRNGSYVVIPGKIFVVNHHIFFGIASSMNGGTHNFLSLITLSGLTKRRNTKKSWQSWNYDKLNS